MTKLEGFSWLPVEILRIKSVGGCFVDQNEQITLVQLITILIAAYAAFVSTMVFVWNVYNRRNDRGKIRVNASFGYLVGGGVTSNIHLIFEFTNVGQKPVQLSNLGGTMYKKYVKDGRWAFVIPCRNIPIKLEPGDRHFEYFDTLQSVNDTVKDIIAYDSLNNKYLLKRKTLNRLKSEVRSL
jgi:hypothetical protein